MLTDKKGGLYFKAVIMQIYKTYTTSPLTAQTTVGS